MTIGEARLSPLAAALACSAALLLGPADLSAAPAEIKVIPGRPAPPEKYRFQAALLWSDSYFSGYPADEPLRSQRCGATLLGGRWALTAAHCVAKRAWDYDPPSGFPETDCLPAAAETLCVFRPEAFVLLTGTSRLDGRPGPDVERVPVVGIRPYDGYAEAPGFEHDIAVLELARAPKGVDRVAPATPAFEQAVRDAALPARIVGWGETEDGAGSVSLRHADLPLRDTGLCDERYRHYRVWAEGRRPQPEPVVTPNMLCAGADLEPERSCYGDSGGFLGYPDAAGRWVQLGIVSWSSGGCDTPYMLDVYTRVAAYRTWIADVTGLPLAAPGDPVPDEPPVEAAAR